MSRYGYNSDHRQGERDFERNGRYGYDKSRYLGYDRESRDYRDGFDEARRAEDRRREDREAEEAAERRAEYSWSHSDSDYRRALLTGSEAAFSRAAEMARECLHNASTLPHGTETP